MLLMDNNLDVAIVGMLEQKLGNNIRFQRVDSDSIDKLIVKEDNAAAALEYSLENMVTTVFNSQMPKLEKVDFNVNVQPMGENALPIMIARSEYMRRMKEMATIQSGMGFYGELPDMMSVIINQDHKLVKRVMDETGVACNDKVKPLSDELDALQARAAELKKAKEGKKEEDIPEAEKNELTDVEKQIADKEDAIKAIYTDYATGNKVVHELIDLALLQNGMLKGEALNSFIKRSVELI